MSKCRTCSREADQLTTVIRGGVAYSGCEHCIDSVIQQGNEGSAKYYRDRQIEDYRKDITQPNQGRDYIKAYGVEAARSRGWSDELIRKLS